MESSNSRQQQRGAPAPQEHGQQNEPKLSQEKPAMASTTNRTRTAPSLSDTIRQLNGAKRGAYRVTVTASSQWNEIKVCLYEGSATRPHAVNHIDRGHTIEDRQGAQADLLACVNRMLRLPQEYSLAEHQLLRIHTEGILAYRFGQGLESCPYQDEHRANIWRSGYANAANPIR